MPNDLFIGLEKYCATGERTQTENFLTELVAYLLREECVARETFVRLVAREQAEQFLDGTIDIRTQCFSESRNPRLNGLFLDIVLACGESELIIENKVGDELTRQQLRNYLDYALERNRRWLAVVTKAPQEAVRELPNHSRFLRETLWWEVADKWAQSKAQFKCTNLIEGVLEFMRRYEMGPVDGFTIEQLGAPRLWRKFVENRDGILTRLIDEIVDPEWPDECDLRRHNGFPNEGTKQALHYRGLVWNMHDVPPGGLQDTFWYFLGFRYSDLEWQPPLLQSGQPECAVFLGCWGEPRIKEFLEELRTQLPSASEFEVKHSQDGAGIFLCRRRPIDRFTGAVNQASEILDFFKQSHDALCPMVPKVRNRHRELVANLQLAEQN